MCVADIFARSGRRTCVGTPSSLSYVAPSMYVMSDSMVPTDGSASVVSSGFSKLSPQMKSLIQSVTSDFVFGTEKKFSTKKDFDSFVENLGLVYDDNAKTYFGIPPENLGKWSKWNIHGWIVVRRDLPKEERDLGGWTYPYFGDPSKGYGIAHRVVKCYPKEKRYGEQIQASVRAREEDGKVSAICVVEKKFAPSVDPDSRAVLYAASLARHWFDRADVLELADTGAIKLPTSTLDWEVFPPGTTDDDKKFLAAKLGTKVDPKVVAEATSRLTEVKKLGPQQMLIGTSGMERYLGFKFEDDFVVFENIRHGNALYILQENWKDLSKLSRTELLKNHSSEILRIIHKDGWEKKLEHAVNLRRGFNQN